MEQEENKTIGTVLRAAREARGMSREEAAAATRIKAHFLTAMEEDDYHLLPDERYLLRFLDEYATFLGLDPQGVRDRFAQQITRNHSSLAVFPVARTVTVSLRRLTPVLLLVVLVVPSIYIGISLLADRPPPPPPHPGRAGPAGPSEWREPPAGAPVPGESGAADPGLAPTSTIAQAPGIAGGQGAQQILRAKAQEMTWMLVTIDGRETRDVLLRPGELWEWNAQEGFVVTVGNAGGVELSLNGRPLQRLGEPGQVIRDLHLPPETARSSEAR
jgi:cytoskeleton protein RodZ